MSEETKTEEENTDYFAYQSMASKNNKNFETDFFDLVNFLRQNPKEYVKKYIRNNPKIDEEKLKYYLPLLNPKKGTNKLLQSKMLSDLTKVKLRKHLGLPTGNPKISKDQLAGRYYPLYHSNHEAKNPKDVLNDILLNKEQAEKILGCVFKYAGLSVDYFKNAVKVALDLYEKNLLEDDYVLNEDKEESKEMEKERRMKMIKRSKMNALNYPQKNENEEEMEGPIDFRDKRNLEAKGIKVRPKEGKDPKKEIAFISKNGVKVPFGANYVIEENRPGRVMQIVKPTEHHHHHHHSPEKTLKSSEIGKRTVRRSPLQTEGSIKRRYIPEEVNKSQRIDPKYYSKTLKSRSKKKISKPISPSQSQKVSVRGYPINEKSLNEALRSKKSSDISPYQSQTIRPVGTSQSLNKSLGKSYQSRTVKPTETSQSVHRRTRNLNESHTQGELKWSRDDFPENSTMSERLRELIAERNNARLSPSKEGRLRTSANDTLKSKEKMENKTPKYQYFPPNINQFRKRDIQIGEADIPKIPESVLKEQREILKEKERRERRRRIASATHTHHHTHRIEGDTRKSPEHHHTHTHTHHHEETKKPVGI
ncbi:MAG: hypothetical protein MJ252_25545, partial [archaeon]|nr:hypothetical protein [archaeon]